MALEYISYFRIFFVGRGLLPDPHLQASPLWGSQHGGPSYSDKNLPTHCRCYGPEGRREWRIDKGREGQRKGGKRDEVRWRDEKRDGWGRNDTPCPPCYPQWFSKTQRESREINRNLVMYAFRERDKKRMLCTLDVNKATSQIKT